MKLVENFTAISHMGISKLCFYIIYSSILKSSSFNEVQTSHGWLTRNWACFPKRYPSELSCPSRLHYLQAKLNINLTFCGGNNKAGKFNVGVFGQVYLCSQHFCWNNSLASLEWHFDV